MLPRIKADADVQRKIDRAMVRLVTDRPFWASLILNCELVPTNYIPTAATDGVRIAYNPEFFRPMTSEEIQFVLAHEALHKAFMHVLRLNGRNPKLWNWATDYIINDTLVRDGMTMPTNHDTDQLIGLHDTNIADRESLADEVYKKLEKMFPNIQQQSHQTMTGGGSSGGENPEGGDMPDGHLLEPDSINGEGAKTESELKEIANRAERELTQAATIAKQQGMLPGHIESMIDSILKPTIPWRKVLRDFATRVINDDVTWRKPNRRLLGALDIYMPSPDGTGMGKIALCFDTSGSIYHNRETLERFVAELTNIIDDLHPEEIHLIQCDWDVQDYQVMSPEDFTMPPLKGGGGTAFEPAIVHAVQNCDELDCIVYFTDLYGNLDFPDPGVPVLWATFDTQLGQDAVKFGQVLPIGE